VSTLPKSRSSDALALSAAKWHYKASVCHFMRCKESIHSLALVKHLSGLIWGSLLLPL